MVVFMLFLHGLNDNHYGITKNRSYGRGVFFLEKSSPMKLCMFALSYNIFKKFC